jgi:hypothetical protein
MAINPLLDNLSELSEEQLLDIVNDLSKKYFIASSNPQVQGLLLENLEIYRSELHVRQSQNRQAGDDNGLDNLINID